MSADVPPRSRRIRWGLAASGGALLVAIGWAVGLWWFVGYAGRAVRLPPEADGIVALTGGATRIETAFKLLVQGRGQKLLVSGIGRNTDLTALANRAGLDPAPFAERVTLGRNAGSTHGNALETATWARDNHISSLIVVTAYYHMPRAMTEFTQAMPDIRLYPYPVLIDQTGTQDRPVPMRLLIEEYSKFLVATAGLTAWLPDREPMRDLGRDLGREPGRGGRPE